MIGILKKFGSIFMVLLGIKLVLGIVYMLVKILLLIFRRPPRQ